MNRFLTGRIPPFRRVLLVESGSRSLFENLLPGLYQLYGNAMSIDLVTCYAGVPEGYRADRGAVFLVTDYPDAASRKRLFEELKGNVYDIIGIICSAEPIMTKWKWALAWHVPAKLFILNENGDYFWVDRGNWRVVLHFMAFRADMTGMGAITTPLRILLLPFTCGYLFTYAVWAHLRRKRVHA